MAKKNPVPAQLTPFVSGDPRSIEIQRKGNEAAVRARKARASAKATARKILAASPEISAKMKEELKRLGIHKEAGDIDLRTIALVSIAMKAVKGDIAACKLLLQIADDEDQQALEDMSAAAEV